MTKNNYRLLRHGDFVSYESKSYIYMKSEGSLLHMHDGDNKVIADYSLVRLDSFYDRNILHKFTRYIFEFSILRFMLGMLYFTITDYFIHATLSSWTLYVNLILGIAFMVALVNYDLDREIFQ